MTRIAWIECPDCGERSLLMYDPGDELDMLDCENCGGYHGRLVGGIDPVPATELLTWDRKSRDQYLRAAAAHAVRHGYPVEV